MPVGRAGSRPKATQAGVVRPACLTCRREGPRHRPRDGCIAGTGSSTKAAAASGPSTTAGGGHPQASARRLRLKTIFEGVAALIAEHEPDAVALEESFVGADARIALSVGQARGAVLVAAALAGVECTEYAPARVKQAVCGYGRAEKAQVQRMVKAILGAARRCRRRTTRPTRSRSRSATRSRRRS